MPGDVDLAQQVQRLSDRLTVLEDVEALHRLRYRFFQLVNDNHWDQIGDLFSPDAYLDYSYVAQRSGKAAIGEFFARMPAVLEKDDAARETMVRQFGHTHDVRVHGDTATGVTFLEAKTIFDGTSYVVAGKFSDDYVRLDGQWFFAVVKLDIYWMVPLSEGWAQPNRDKGPLARQGG